MRNNPVESLEERAASVASIVGALFVLLTVGCAAVDHAPSNGSSQSGRPSALPTTHAAGESAARTDSPGAKATAKGALSSPVSEQPAKKGSAVPIPKKQPAAPPLDLAALEGRLKETKAIGLFSKIALKNQVDDLLDQFRSYYEGRVKTTLAELRQQYDLLVLKVLSLLQDGDPSLATALGASREAIWGMLADREKFATI